MDGNNYDATQITWSEINIHFDLFYRCRNDWQIKIIFTLNGRYFSGLRVNVNNIFMQVVLKVAMACCVRFLLINSDSLLCF